MAVAPANESPCVVHRTICLPIEEAPYRQLVGDPGAFREWLQAWYRRAPTLFPAGWAHGFTLKDCRTPRKLAVPLEVDIDHAEVEIRRRRPAR